jgi:hypothetical protein
LRAPGREKGVFPFVSTAPDESKPVSISLNLNTTDRRDTVFLGTFPFNAAIREKINEVIDRVLAEWVEDQCKPNQE